MNTNTAVNHQIRLKQSIASLYSSARHFHYTSEQVNEKFNDLMASLPKDSPQWLISFLRGYREGLSDELNNRCITHTYYFHGQHYTNWDSFPEELKELCRKESYDYLWKDTDIARLRWKDNYDKVWF